MNEHLITHYFIIAAVTYSSDAISQILFTTNRVLIQ